MACTNGGCLFLLTIILFASAVFKMSHAQNDDNLNANPVVTIAQGKVAGKVYPCRNNNYALGFTGIPYGQAPVGDLRFRAPLPAKGWGDKIFDGTKPGPACPGVPETTLRTDEDCLHVTVYTPKLPNGTQTSSLPTVVYIFGGMFVGGGLEPYIYNPGYFFGGVDKGVLVLPNFRSGPFGFLSTGDEVAPGNYGMKDIVLALQWVQKNIRDFGGDPNQVTVVGHSSGAASVHFLTLSPLTKGLFHRFGTGSGTFAVGWAYTPREMFVRRTRLLGVLIGCTQDESDKLIRCMRKKPYDVIVQAISLTIFMNPRDLPAWHVTDEPDIDGAFLTGVPYDLMAAGKFHDVSWVIGLARDEGLVLSGRVWNRMDFVRELLANVDDILTIMPLPYQISLNRILLAKALREYYFNDLDVSNDQLFDNVTNWIGEVGVTYPVCLAARHWVSQAKSPVYFYSFDFAGTHSASYRYCNCRENLGIGHSEDAMYLFDASEYLQQYTNKAMTDKDFEIVDAMVSLWLSFATTGIPNPGPGTPTWKPFTIAEESVLSIGEENNVVFTLVENYCRDRISFVDDVIAKLT